MMKVGKGYARFLSVILVFVVLLFVSTTVFFLKQEDSSSHTLMLYVDKTLKPLLDEASSDFNNNQTIRFKFVYGSSGYVLSQLNLTKEGDIYGSDDYTFAKLAVKKGLVYPDTIKIIGYLTLGIIVEKNNPNNIKGLDDLLYNKTGLIIAIGDPSHVAAGILAKEILESNGLWEILEERHKVVYAASAADAANMVKAGSADVALTFSIFYYLDKNEKLELIPIEEKYVTRLAPLVIGIVKYTHNYNLAMKFINYISSKEFEKVIESYGFILPQKARAIYPNAFIPSVKDIVGDNQ